MINVQFTVTATNVSLADTTPQNIHEIDTDDQIIRIPRMLKLHKEANPAFTISNVNAPALVERKDQMIDSYAAMASGGPFMIIELVDNDGRGRPYFFVPIKGFLDVATEQRRLALPVLEGACFNPTGKEKYWRMRFSCNVASGEAAVKGELFYDEVSVGGW